jgi:predicted Zn-dependent peptidase
MVKNVDDIAAVRAEIEATIAKFQQEPVDQKRLEDLKRRTKYGFLMSLDTPARVAGGLSRWVALTGGVDVVDEFYANLEKVTTEDVLNAARYYYTQDRRTVVVLKGAAQ